MSDDKNLTENPDQVVDVPEVKLFTPVVVNVIGFPLTVCVEYV